MAKKTIRISGPDALAAELFLLSRELDKVYRWITPDRDNPIYYMVQEAGQLYHRTAQAQSPEWTGLLIENHMLSGIKWSGSAAGKTATAEQSLFINPDPTIRHSIIPDSWPGEYGPRYHQERRAWFEEAHYIVEPMFDQIVNEHFTAAFRDRLF